MRDVTKIETKTIKTNGHCTVPLVGTPIFFSERRKTKTFSSFSVNNAFKSLRLKRRTKENDFEESALPFTTKANGVKLKHERNNCTCGDNNECDYKNVSINKPSIFSGLLKLDNLFYTPTINQNQPRKTTPTICKSKGSHLPQPSDFRSISSKNLNASLSYSNINALKSSPRPNKKAMNANYKDSCDNETTSRARKSAEPRINFWVYRKNVCNNRIADHRKNDANKIAGLPKNEDNKIMDDVYRKSNDDSSLKNDKTKGDHDIYRSLRYSKSSRLESVINEAPTLPSFPRPNHLEPPPPPVIATHILDSSYHSRDQYERLNCDETTNKENKKDRVQNCSEMEKQQLNHMLRVLGDYDPPTNNNTYLQNNYSTHQIIKNSLNIDESNTLSNSIEDYYDETYSMNRTHTDSTNCNDCYESKVSKENGLDKSSNPSIHPNNNNIAIGIKTNGSLPRERKQGVLNHVNAAIIKQQTLQNIVSDVNPGFGLDDNFRLDSTNVASVMSSRSFQGGDVPENSPKLITSSPYEHYYNYQESFSSPVNALAGVNYDLSENYPVSISPIKEDTINDEFHQYVNKLSNERNEILKFVIASKHRLIQLQALEDETFHQLVLEKTMLEKDRNTEMENLFKEQREIGEYQKIGEEYIQSLERQKDEKLRHLNKLKENIEKSNNKKESTKPSTHRNDISSDKHESPLSALDDSQQYEDLEFQVFEMESKIEEERERIKDKILSQKDRFLQKYKYTQDKLAKLEPNHINNFEKLRTNMEIIKEEKEKINNIIAIKSDHLSPKNNLESQIFNKSQSLNRSPLNASITNEEPLFQSQVLNNKLMETNQEELLRKRASEEIKHFWKNLASSPPHNNHVYHLNDMNYSPCKDNSLLNNSINGYDKKSKPRNRNHTHEKTSLLCKPLPEKCANSLLDSKIEEVMLSLQGIRGIKYPLHSPSNSIKFNHSIVNGRNTRTSLFRKLSQESREYRENLSLMSKSLIDSTTIDSQQQLLDTTRPSHCENKDFSQTQNDNFYDFNTLPLIHLASTSTLSSLSPPSSTSNSSNKETVNLSNRETAKILLSSTNNVSRKNVNVLSPSAHLLNDYDSKETEKSVQLPYNNDYFNQYFSSNPSMPHLYQRSGNSFNNNNYDAHQNDPARFNDLTYASKGSCNIAITRPCITDLVSYVNNIGGHSLERHEKLIGVTKTCARGYLFKLSFKFKIWQKRWFVFDKLKRNITYYVEKSELKPKGVIYFQAIEEVYTDHASSYKPPTLETSFCLKTYEKLYYLCTASSEISRIWVDLLSLGIEGRNVYNS
ncbi:unnamed protein product [Gordionus sp. m RMFG-2023]